MKKNRTPLYGHTSPETAYTVDDYPYGFRLRCKIRYWLEKHPKRGYRLMSQTTNPKREGMWNKPKGSTYTSIAACMYLYEGRVVWDGVSEYSSASDALAFVRDFPLADIAGESFKVGLAGSLWSRVKAKTEQKFASGEAFVTINGVREPLSEKDRERHVDAFVTWSHVADEIERVKVACREHTDCVEHVVLALTCGEASA